MSNQNSHNLPFSPSSSSSFSVMSKLFSKMVHFQELIFARNILTDLSSFAFGIVFLCLQRGAQILEKKRLLRMVAVTKNLDPHNLVPPGPNTSKGLDPGPNIYFSRPLKRMDLLVVVGPPYKFSASLKFLKELFHK